MVFTAVHLLIVVWLVSLNQAVGADKVTEPVKVHFVPHSHMDAGWLKTYDQYYDTQVHKILTSVFK